MGRAAPAKMALPLWLPPPGPSAPPADVGTGRKRPEGRSLPPAATGFAEGGGARGGVGTSAENPTGCGRALGFFTALCVFLVSRWLVQKVFKHLLCPVSYLLSVQGQCQLHQLRL